MANYLAIGALGIVVFMLGQVFGAQSAVDDPFITRLEALFGVHPGSYIPADARAPDIRLQYRATHSIGHGCYDVNICRVQ